jgi:hypothetical protein
MPELDPLQTLWTQQDETPFAMSLADIHTRAERFQSRIRVRNWIEYSAAAIVVCAFAWAGLAASHPVAQLGAWLVALGAIYVCWKLYALARAASRREMDQAASWADFHRGELVRQRNALQSVWRWYLGPLVPGLVLFWIGAGLASPADAPPFARIVIPAIGIGVSGVAFFAIASLNAAAAKSLQAQIAALDALMNPEKS